MITVKTNNQDCVEKVLITTYRQHAAKTQQNKLLRFSFKALPLLSLAAERYMQPLKRHLRF